MPKSFVWAPSNFPSFPFPFLSTSYKWVLSTLSLSHVNFSVLKQTKKQKNKKTKKQNKKRKKKKKIIIKERGRSWAEWLWKKEVEGEIVITSRERKERATTTSTLTSWVTQQRVKARVSRKVSAKASTATVATRAVAIFCICVAACEHCEGWALCQVFSFLSVLHYLFPEVPTSPFFSLRDCHLFHTKVYTL